MLDHGSWIATAKRAEWTVVRAHAQQFRSRQAATSAINLARRLLNRPFSRAEVVADV
jgi:hypothetical protein